MGGGWEGGKGERKTEVREGGGDQSLPCGWPLHHLSSYLSVYLPALPSSYIQAPPICPMSSELAPASLCSPAPLTLTSSASIASSVLTAPKFILVALDLSSQPQPPSVDT